MAPLQRAVAPYQALVAESNATRRIFRCPWLPTRRQSNNASPDVLPHHWQSNQKPPRFASGDAGRQFKYGSTNRDPARTHEWRWNGTYIEGEQPAPLWSR